MDVIDGSNGVKRVQMEMKEIPWSKYLTQRERLFMNFLLLLGTGWRLEEQEAVKTRPIS